MDEIGLGKKGQRLKVVESAVATRLSFIVSDCSLLPGPSSRDQMCFARKGQRLNIVESAEEPPLHFFNIVSSRK